MPKPRKDRQVGVKLAKKVRMRKSLALRMAGVSFRDIGEKFGVSHTTIKRDVETVLAEDVAAHKGEAEQHRTLSLERLEEQTRRVSERLALEKIPCPKCKHLIVDPDKDVHLRHIASEDLLLKINHQRNRVTGAYSPIRFLFELQFEYVTEALIPVISRYFLGLGADAKLIESLASDMSAALVAAGKRFTISGPGSDRPPIDVGRNGGGGYG